ncbi:MAG: hypothetical protein H6Q60_775 [Oscillospiraceae bacterium]|nr:hypothetical protein [Oscillospiraceae bacterium]
MSKIKRETFVVQILSNQNETWQGTVTWANQRETIVFRSALELIQLMDSVIGTEEKEEDAQ